jgi:mycofactocin biosynthesis protein MftB
VSTDPAGASRLNPAGPALLNPAGPARLNPAGPEDAFDLDRAWRLDERVAVRPEPFGALLYHFGTRRLSFLKNTTMLAVLRSLGEHPSARAACTAAGVQPGSLAAYQRGLAVLAESHMITPGMITPGMITAQAAL